MSAHEFSADRVAVTAVFFEKFLLRGQIGIHFPVSADALAAAGVGYKRFYVVQRVAEEYAYLVRKISAAAHPRTQFRNSRRRPRTVVPSVGEKPRRVAVRKQLTDHLAVIHQQQPPSARNAQFRKPYPPSSERGQAFAHLAPAVFRTGEQTAGFQPAESKTAIPAQAVFRFAHFTPPRLHASVCRTLPSASAAPVSPTVAPSFRS